MLVVPSIDVAEGRSRLVFWPGASSGTGTPTDRPERIARHFVELGAPAIHVVDLDGARAGRPVALEVGGPDRGGGRRTTAGGRRGGWRGPDPPAVRGRRHARRHAAPGRRRGPGTLRACLEVAGELAGRGPGPAAGTAGRVPVAREARSHGAGPRGAARRRRGAALRALPRRGGARPGPARPRSWPRPTRTSPSPAESSSLEGIRRLRGRRDRRRDPRARRCSPAAIEYQAAVAAAAGS